MKHVIRLLGTLAIVGLAGCASSEPLELPTGMASSLPQDPNRPGAWIYKAPNVDFRRYTRFIVEPVTVYRGTDATYGELTDAQVTEIAQLLTSETRRALSNGYTVTSKPGPNTVRIVLKLAGVEDTVTGAATVSRIVPIGAIANAVQGASGGSGSFTGAVILAAEFYDAQSSKLIAAAVRRYSPPVFDLEATLSTMDTARAATRAAAEDLRAAVDRAHGKSAP